MHRRDELAGQWRSAHEIHAAVSERVSEHNGFLHELPHLWESYRDSPDNRSHLKKLHDDSAADLVRFLVEEAAKLDQLAVSEPLRLVHRSEPAFAPGPDGPDDPDDDGPADEPDPVTAFERQLREREQLTEALQYGRRIERIPYDGLTA